MTTIHKTLQALELAETLIKQVVPDDMNFDRQILTLDEATRLSLAAHECYCIRVELMRYFDPRNQQQEDE